MTDEKRSLREEALETYRYMQRRNPNLFEAIKRFDLEPESCSPPDKECLDQEPVAEQIPHQPFPRPEDKFVVIASCGRLDRYFCRTKHQATKYRQAIHDYDRINSWTYTKHQAIQKGLWKPYSLNP